MIDIGVNLLNGQFDRDLDEVMTRAWAAGLSHMIITGTDPVASAGAADLAATDPLRLSATAGIHPHHAADAPPDWDATIRALCARPEVVAVGETGLDFHRNFSPRDAQERIFRQHLALAAELQLPLFVHDREAGEAVAQGLREAGPLPAGVVVHCFTGTAADLDRYLELGCSIGITGWVCDRRRGQALRELVPRIPLQRLMIETDAPFLKPHNAPEAGRRNEPCLLPYVAAKLAELLGLDPAELIRSTAANARALFNLSGA